MTSKILAVVAAPSFSLATSASAAVFVLDFEGINATYPSNDSADIGGFHNGGTSSEGTSGTNFGVSFSWDGLCPD